MKKYFLFLALIIIANLLVAQNEIKDTVVLKEVSVITSSKHLVSVGNVTQKIDVISQKEIEKTLSGNRNISDYLKYIPGVSVSVLSRNDANWGTYGGIGSKYSTYMLNGLPIDAFIDGQSLNTLCIDRVEVQRGPASVLYPNYLSQDFAGNQSPLAGTVNIILKNKIETPITKASLAYGSYNTFNTNLYHQATYGNTGFFAGVDFEKSDYTNYGTQGSWLNMHKNPEYNKTKLFAGFNWHPGGSEKHIITIFANHTSHKGDVGRVYRCFENEYTLINVGYDFYVNDNVSVKANAGYRNYDRSWQESNFGVIDTLKSNNGAVQKIIPADFAVVFKHGEKNRFTSGIDYQNADYYTWSDPLQGYKSLGNKSNTTQAGVYVQEEVYINQLIFRGGIRLNSTKSQIALINGGAPGQPSQSWNSFIWNLGLKHHISPVIDLYINAGNSFMPPGLKSVGGTIPFNKKGMAGYNGQLPNPNLKPESGFNLDGGVDVNLNNKMSLALRLFHTEVNDAIIDIAVSQNPSQSQSINAGNSKAAGVEFQAGQRLNDRFKWFANFTYIKTKISNKDNADQDGAIVPFSPEKVANLGLDYLFPFGFSISPYLNYNDGYFDSNSKSSRKYFKQGALLNVTASQKIIQTGKYHLDVFGQFYNITNNKFEMPWQFQDPGFSFMIGIKAIF
jgi:iron complex outermembrane recepter protein